MTHDVLCAVMMKLGCMSLSLKGMDAAAFVHQVYDWGLDVVELHTSAFASTEVEYLRDLKLTCLKKGLPIGYIGVSNNFGKPAAELPEQVALVKKWVDVAAFMGAPLVRVFAAYVPKDCPDESALWQPMIECLKEVAAYGAEKGVIIGLQNHNHHCVTRTGADVLRILREVNHPSFSHIMDTGQYVGSPGASGHKESDNPEDNYHSLEQTAPHAVYVRTKFYRIDSGVEEWLDYPRIFRILRSVGYNGGLSIVYEGKSEPKAAIEKSAAYLRKLMREM